MRSTILILAAGLALGGCASQSDQASPPPPASTLPTGTEPVQLTPAEFTTAIDNPYWPMRPGMRWVYREVAGDGTAQRVVVRVTGRVKRIMGIEARVVRDTVTEGGNLVEDTVDWYAQDAAGNIWYLGEDTTEFEDGKPVSKKGSWEAGVNGAQPGVAVPAEPRPGLAYRQEYLEGEAEDAAEVLSVGERVEVPFGSYTGVLMTKDFTPLDPKILEHKFYARGVGPVLVLAVSGGSDREELLRFTK